MKKIGFIGAGNMATAIINGIISSGIAKPSFLSVFDIDGDKLSQFSNQGILPKSNAHEVVSSSDIVVLAVKPQNYREVLEAIAPSLTANNVLVSIAAGISTAYIRDIIKNDCYIVRVMPNTPLLLGKGSTAMTRPQNMPEDLFKAVYDMFAVSGVVEILPEGLMNTVISVNGSSPAYIYLFAKAMVDYATEQGIEYAAALNLACATLKGSAEMLMRSGDTPDILIKKVSSPGGTTLKALESLDNDGFYDSIKKAMAACTQRAEELGK